MPYISDSKYCNQCVFDVSAEQHVGDLDSGNKHYYIVVAIIEYCSMVDDLKKKF